MNCEKCHKNHATIHLTAIENGMKKEAHLCDECARQTGVHLKFNFSISDLLGGLMEPPKTPKVNQIRCPECGITYSEFKTRPAWAARTTTTSSAASCCASWRRSTGPRSMPG